MSGSLHLRPIRLPQNPMECGKDRCRVGRAVAQLGPSPDSGPADFPHPALPPMGRVVPLTPLPSAVLVTCRATSRRWTWVPPAAHTDTGRLCSAGSKGVPVLRRLRSSAALRLPASVSHGSGSPGQWPPALRGLLRCLSGRRHVPPPRVVRRRRGTGSPSRRERSRRGEGFPGDGAGLCVRARVAHPAGSHPLLAQQGLQGLVVAFRSNRTLGLRAGERCRGRMPPGPHGRRPPPRRGHCWPRRQAGSRRGRAHPWPGRMRTCWTTHTVS